LNKEERLTVKGVAMKKMLQKTRTGSALPKKEALSHQGCFRAGEERTQRGSAGPMKKKI